MDQEPKNLILSLSSIRILLYGDQNLEGVTPVTKSTGDTAKVLVVPLPFGVTLKRMDVEENYFHIELIQNNPTSPDHAEIWLAFEWKESNTRHSRRLALAHEERQFRHKNETRLTELTEHFKSMNFTQPGYAEHLANLVLKNYKSGDFKAALSALAIADKLARFEEEDKQNT